MDAPIAQLEEQTPSPALAFTWHELDTPNIKEAIEFYTNALGFGSQEVPVEEGTVYQLLTLNGKDVCGVMDSSITPGLDDAKAHWAVYLAVDDVDARVQKCIKFGATLSVTPMEGPNIGRMALIRDPQGAHLWLNKAGSVEPALPIVETEAMPTALV